MMRVYSKSYLGHDGMGWGRGCGLPFQGLGNDEVMKNLSAVVGKVRELVAKRI